MLRAEIFEELKTILLEDYQIELSLEETKELGHNLISYFDLITKIYHENNGIIEA